jgi:hypothetical protein
MDYFFTLYLLDDDGGPMGEFKPRPVDQGCAVAWIDDGQVGMSRMLFGALISGVAMTTVSTEFEWGNAHIHLPQAWEGETNPDDIGRVLAGAEDAMKQAAGLAGPTGEKAAYGPPEGIQGPHEIDLDDPRWIWSTEDDDWRIIE